MSYRPSQISEGRPPEFRVWLGDELRRISQAFEQLDNVDLVIQSAEPSRFAEGLIQYFDGVGFDPGEGAGPYYRSASGWVKMDGGPGPFLPAGTVTDGSLRWDGAAWVESTTILIGSGPDVAIADANPRLDFIDTTPTTGDTWRFILANNNFRIFNASASDGELRVEERIDLNRNYDPLTVGGNPNVIDFDPTFTTAGLPVAFSPNFLNLSPDVTCDTNFNIVVLRGGGSYFMTGGTLFTWSMFRANPVISTATASQVMPSPNIFDNQATFRVDSGVACAQNARFVAFHDRGNVEVDDPAGTETLLNDYTSFLSAPVTVNDVDGLINITDRYGLRVQAMGAACDTQHGVLVEAMGSSVVENIGVQVNLQNGAGSGVDKEIFLVGGGGIYFRDDDTIITSPATGILSVGTLPFDADQTVGAGQDNFVLTYDDASSTILLEAAGAGSPFATPLRILADINTATPPTTEQPTGLLEFRDLADDDLIASIGFNAGNDFEIRNFFQQANGTALLTIGVDDALGGLGSHMQFASGVNGSIDINSENDIALMVNDGQPGIAINGAGDVRLYHNNVRMAETIPNTSGGFRVDNGVTGTAGTRTRVLTIDDLPSVAYLQMRTQTDAQLDDITDAINTDAGKIQGASVYNATQDVPVWAVGNADGSVWVDGAGATVNTPV